MAHVANPIRLAAIVFATAAGLALPATADAACGGLLGGILQPRCPLPPPSPPDPGGSESPDQPVPAPGGKVFGFNASLYLSGQSTPEEELDAARAAGANIHRLPVSWAWLQPTPETPLPAPEQTADPNTAAGQIDRFYVAALARGIKPVFITYWAPRWATRYARCGLLDFGCQSIANSKHKLVPEPAYLDEYENFVAAVKTRWPRAIIESWNEPDLYWGDPSYKGSRAFSASPEYFKEIQCAAYRGSKRVNADVVVAAGWSMLRGAEYVRRVYAAGGDSCWDVANVHAYPDGQTDFGPNSALAYVMDKLRQFRQAYGDTSPILVTETGYTTTGGDPVSEATQADATRRLYNRFVTMPDTLGVVFHTLRDAPLDEYPYNDWRSREYGYGFLRGDWTAKPVYCDFVAAAGNSNSRC